MTLRQVKQGKLTQSKAAEQLRLSVRWVKKLMQRLRQEGDRGLAHRLRGRPSNRGHGPEVRQRALALIAGQYADNGPTLASEVLASEHGLEVSRETLRQWMSQEQLWKARRARVKRVHVWRPRRAQRGELVQWTRASTIGWKGAATGKLYLIAMIDDASGELTARFALHDSTEENMRLLSRYLERHGHPVEVYTDKAGLFQVNRPLALQQASTGSSRADPDQARLGGVGDRAHSPQAKGRVERSFGTMQDRLVKGLRRAGASTLEQANRYLWEVFEPEWNQRFAKRPASDLDAHRASRKDHNLASILSYVETRMVNNDYTLHWLGERYQIAAKQVRPSTTGSQRTF